MKNLASLCLFLAACGGDMTVDETADAGDPGAPTYSADIAPALGVCAGCHAGGSPQGNYRTGSYADLLGNGSDGTPNVVAGDASSRLVQYMSTGTNHQNANGAVPGIAALVHAWVVDSGAAE